MRNGTARLARDARGGAARHGAAFLRTPALRAALTVAAAAAAGFAPQGSPLEAQEARTLAIECDAQAGGHPTMCARAVGAGRDVATDIGLLAGPGAEVPGQGSALGRRIGGSPRFAPWIRAAGHTVGVPDLTDPAGTGEASFFVPALQAGLGLGVFDGFSVLPTVGGVLSVDVVGQASFVFLPQDRGFDGRADVYSVGARVGLLRESFTLPGVTLSVARRFAGSVRLGDTTGGDAGEVLIDPSVTSLRATVGKDLYAFGVLLGAGWDDFSSETTARVIDGSGGFATVGSTLETSRTLYFLGLSRQLGVLSWVSLEVGWAQGLDPVEIGSASSPDRGSTVFGSLALMLKL